MVQDVTNIMQFMADLKDQSQRAVLEQMTGIELARRAVVVLVDVDAELQRLDADIAQRQARRDQVQKDVDAAAVAVKQAKIALLDASTPAAERQAHDRRIMAEHELLEQRAHMRTVSNSLNDAQDRRMRLLRLREQLLAVHPPADLSAVQAILGAH